MALTTEVQRGYTFTDEVRFGVDDLNAAALPSVTVRGSVGSSDIAAGSVNSTHLKPGPIAYALTTGSADAYVADPSPALSALTAGAWLILKLNVTNTGAATLNVNSLGAKALKKLADQDVEAGDLRSGALVEVRYDGTAWQLAEPGLPGRLYAELSGSVNAYTGTLAGVTVGDVTDLAGRVIVLKVGAALTNTGASTLNLNGLGATTIKNPAGSDVSAGDLTAGRLVAVMFDGTYFQLVTSVTYSLPNVGPGSGSIAYPTSITLDANGRVTAASPGTAPAFSALAKVVFDGSVTVSSQNTVSSDATADTVEITAHGFTDGQLVWFQSTAIGGTTALTPYYVEEVDADNFMLHTTLAGAIAHSGADRVNITSTGAVVQGTSYWASDPLLGTPGNVDGVIKNTATGVYFVDFETDASDAHYAVSGSVQSLAGASVMYFTIPVSLPPTTAGCWVAGFDEGGGFLASTRISVLCTQ